MYNDTIYGFELVRISIPVINLKKEPDGYSGKIMVENSAGTLIYNANIPSLSSYTGHICNNTITKTISTSITGNNLELTLSGNDAAPILIEIKVVKSILTVFVSITPVRFNLSDVVVSENRISEMINEALGVIENGTY